MSRQYKSPAGNPAVASTIGPQLVNEYFQKQALIEARKEQYFTQLASVTNMPKNHGKRIVRYHYLPLLDDANVNDQGLDASGAAISNGNLYGSSKDIGTIPGKFPVLGETGGRVNRVGFTRKVIEGTFESFGFFQDYTQDSVDFDSDAELMQHINREMINGANKTTEDALQIDLLNAAGVVKYAGSATQNSEVNNTSIVKYGDLMRLSIDLDNNRTPKQTTVITGTRMIDTRTIPNGRVMYIGSELIPTIQAMKDLHGNPAFVSVEKYAAAGTVLNGEIGTVDRFRLVCVPEMLNWTGAGATVASGDEDHYTDGTKYNIYPMLVVGSESFTTIGFQTDGKSVKFVIKHKKPGDPELSDPYGKTGLSSIQWYYGFMVFRPERIGLIKTAAKM